MLRRWSRSSACTISCSAPARLAARRVSPSCSTSSSPSCSSPSRPCRSGFSIGSNDATAPASGGPEAMDFGPIFENYRLYLDGLALTLQLVFWALVIGLVFAVPLAVMRISTNPLVNGPVWAFTYFFRGTPLLVQMFLLYYGLGQMQFMIDLSQSLTFLKDAYWYALVAFTLNTCAYTTEIFRGAIVGTPYGEIEAARA